MNYIESSAKTIAVQNHVLPYNESRSLAVPSGRGAHGRTEAGFCILETKL